MSLLKQLLAILNLSHVYIQMHDYPDQDAIASAFGLSMLLHKNKVNSTLIYHGIIDKEDTIKMIEQLHIAIKPVEECQFTNEDQILLIDGQKGNTNMLTLSGNILGCIDHHNYMSTEDYSFHDIRPDIGACSTIIASYFKEHNYIPTMKVATALLYGIKIDTSQLSSGVSPLDLAMFQWLYTYSDPSLLRSFESNSLKPSDLKRFELAFKNLTITNHLAITNIGANCSEAIIGTVNDLLVTISGVEVTVIYSLRNNGIKFSIRSKTPSIDANMLIKNVLKDIGDGGGHSNKAAGYVPVNDKNNPSELINLIISRISHNIKSLT